MKFSQKGFTPIILILLIPIFLVGLYLTYQYLNRCPEGTISTEVGCKGMGSDLSLLKGKVSIWKTYTYPELNVSFKLPPDWKVAKIKNSQEQYWGALPISPEELTIKSPSSDNFYFFYYDNPKNLTLKQFEIENHEEPPPNSLGTGMGISPGVYDPDAQERDVIVGIKAYHGQTMCEPAICLFYVIPYNKKIYKLNLGPISIEEQGLKIEEILSTFTFLDQATNSDDVIDVLACTPGVTINRVYGLGSDSISVKSPNGQNCILNSTNEIEGGYTENECSVPRSLGKVTFTNLDANKYCKQIKQGNLLMENK